jgi:rhamnosyltransferase
MISGTIVVLFHPSKEHISNLLSLKQSCTHMVAVDNSLSPHPGLEARLAAEGIDCVSNFNRGGIAGAYNRGLEILTAKGVSLFFFFDQDSKVPPNYFADMERRCGEIPDTRFLVGPKILDINVNRYLPAHVITRFGFSPISQSAADRGLLPCSSLISSGSVISADAYRSLGPFSEDLVIDHVDTEYCFRAASQGIPIYINTGLTIEHQLSRRVDHKWLFLTLTEWDMSPLRQYYSARNCIHICRWYGLRFPILLLINVITLQQIVSVMLFEKEKWKKLIAMLAGIADGLSNRFGSIETHWPGLTATVRGQNQELSPGAPPAPAR